MSDCRSSVVVAIPVKNEAERISNCLRALSAQRGSSEHQVVLLLNNCTDGSAAIAAALAKNLRIRVHLFEASIAARQTHPAKRPRHRSFSRDTPAQIMKMDVDAVCKLICHRRQPLILWLVRLESKRARVANHNPRHDDYLRFAWLRRSRPLRPVRKTLPIDDPPARPSTFVDLTRETCRERGFTWPGVDMDISTLRCGSSVSQSGECATCI